MNMPEPNSNQGKGLYVPVPVPAIERFRAADQALGDTLPLISGVLAVLLFAAAIFQFLLLPPPGSQILSSTAGITTLITAVLFVVLTRRNQPPTGWSHSIGFLLISILLFNLTLHIYWQRDATLTIFLALLLAFTGFFLLSTAWLVIALVLILAAWFALLTMIPSADWTIQIITVLITLVLSILAHLSRLKTLNRIVQLQNQTTTLRNELANVLVNTEEAQRSLATSMAVGQRITSILDTDVLLNQVAILIQTRFNLYAVNIFLLDPAQDSIRLHGSTGINGRTLNIIDPVTQTNFSLKVSEKEGIVAWAAARRRSLNVEDVTKDPRYFSVDWLQETRSELALPLEFGTHLLGVLDLQSTKISAFHDDNVPYLQLLADQVAIAINNANLYQQVRRFNADLENVVNQRTDDLHKAYEKLERLDKAKSDFIGVASHELRTPLAVVQGYSQMLLDEPVIQAEARYNVLVKGVLSGVQRLLEIIESMVDVAKIENRELILYPTPIPLTALVSSIVEIITSTNYDRQVQIIQDTAGLPSIQADVDALRKVLHHLIINAIKFTPDGRSVTIRGRELPAGSFDIDEPTVEIVVADTGIGIDPSHHELIFERFYSTDRISLHSTGKTKYKGKGPGLGLSIAKGIIEAHGGKIWVESPGNDEILFPGSQFHVVLPTRK